MLNFCVSPKSWFFFFVCFQTLPINSNYIDLTRKNNSDKSVVLWTGIELILPSANDVNKLEEVLNVMNEPNERKLLTPFTLEQDPYLMRALSNRSVGTFQKSNRNVLTQSILLGWERKFDQD